MFDSHEHKIGQVWIENRMNFARVYTIEKIQEDCAVCYDSRVDIRSLIPLRLLNGSNYILETKDV